MPHTGFVDDKLMVYSNPVKRLFKIVAFTAALAVILFPFWLLLFRHYPLKKYGLSYKKTCGEHDSFQHMQFYLNKDQRKIEGPEITGNELYVEYDHPTSMSIPDIVVRSGVYSDRYVVLRLNLKDKKRPEFEITRII